jgi:uncharacterized membrane protein YadS
MYQETYGAPLALQAATVTKLLRNMSMAVLIPVIATRFRNDGRALKASDITSAVPGFVFVFLAAILARTAGDAWIAGGGAAWAGTWASALGAASTVSAWALASALAGIGLNTDLARLRGLGLKPFVVGLVAALVVGLVSATILRVVYS